MPRLTTKERARRQRVMMALRSWMESNGIARQEIADALGITKGHLSTLINANRTATESQCEQAEAIMDGGPLWGVSPPQAVKAARPKKRAKKKRPEKKVKASPKPNKLRPLTKFETEFVRSVALSWIKTNKTASTDELVDVVRALANGIRT